MTRKETFTLKAEKQIARLHEIERAITGQTNDRHIYVYSRPGIGKSHYLTELLDRSHVRYERITGAISMAAFGVTLATMYYRNQDANQVFVLIDDCDSLLSDTEWLNTMKNVMEGQNRSYQYNKTITKLLSSLDEEEKKAVNFCRDASRVGFEVPTNKFVFIFLSNHQLPTDKDNNTKKSSIYYNASEDRKAIRSRCKTIDLCMDNNVQWGWINIYVRQNNIIGKRLDRFDNKEQIIELILDWMFNNREEMKEFSLRTVQKLAETYELNPDGYIGAFENEFLEAA
jgi:hypothetical protein